MLFLSTDEITYAVIASRKYKKLVSAKHETNNSP